MKPLDRRKFMTVSSVIGGAALLPKSAAGETNPEDFANDFSILYDATRCIGCRSCSQRCRKENGLPPDDVKMGSVRFDMPQKLSERNWMVLQLYREAEWPETGEPPKWSFVKKNCMHCNVPSCASACPVAALHKTEDGPVAYEEDRCIGCRYCLLACPYQVPRYEWLDRVPRVRKCTNCGTCVEACPVGALWSGTRTEALQEAHRRIDENPSRYVEHVYGEREAGGASYLIVSGIPHEEYGLPQLPPVIHSSYADAVMSGLPGWVIGMGLFLGGLYQMEKRLRRAAEQSVKREQEADS